MLNEPTLHGTDGVFQEARQRIYKDKPLSALPKWALENLCKALSLAAKWDEGQKRTWDAARELLRQRKVKTMLKYTGGKKA